VRELAVELASARSLVAVSAELEASLARDEEELPNYADEIGSRNELEPYRRKLSFMWWRLGNDGYVDAAALLDDLRMIRASLIAHGGRRVADGRVARLERMVELFGFHVAKLDIRLHARDLETNRAREAVDAAVEARRKHGPESLDTLIISGTSSADDVHRALRTERRAVGGAVVRDRGRPHGGAGDPRPAARGRSLLRARARRGDGGLLRLGQGRRLPRGAVGDLPRAGRARGRRAAVTTSS